MNIIDRRNGKFDYLVNQYERLQWMLEHNE